jgi:hypothetical protein
MVTGSAWLGPLSDYTANCRAVLSSEWSPHRNETAITCQTKENLKSGLWAPKGPNTKKNWPTDRRSYNQLELQCQQQSVTMRAPDSTDRDKRRQLQKLRQYCQSGVAMAVEREHYGNSGKKTSADNRRLVRDSWPRRLSACIVKWILRGESPINPVCNPKFHVYKPHHY